jgi:SAM-dependent methyltransferase
MSARPERRGTVDEQPWVDSLFEPSAGPSPYPGSDPAPARLRLVNGGHVTLDVGGWHGALGAVDADVLSRSTGPVIDIGCGPGRHVHSLLVAGEEAIGIDVSPAAVRAARRRGVPAVHTSVWGKVPRPGHWRTALLLDGNIGIGGDPVALLRRTAELLDAAGRVIVELVSGPRPGSHLVRVEHRGRAGPWFAWALVTPSSVVDVASAAGLRVDEVWEAGKRWFAVLSVQSGAVDEQSTASGPAA